MTYNYQTIIFNLPSFGVSLLETILAPEAAENMIGDLAEEYYAKAHEESHQSARRWFWLQVYKTCWFSIWEDGAIRRVLEKVGRRYWKPFVGWSITFDGDRFVRRTSSHVMSSFLVFFCLSPLYLNGPPNILTEELLAESENLSMTIAPSEEVQSYESKASKENKALAKSSAGSTALEPAQRFTATAYALPGRTASGQTVRRGIIAADKSLPLGTRVRLDAGHYSGEYVVADRGGRVRGRIIDIWVPSNGETIRFGRRPVKLTILSYGAKKTKHMEKMR